MRKIVNHLYAASLALLFCAASNPVLGANGTWTNTLGGSWPNAANWSGGTIPGALDDTADFSTLTLGSAPVVTLDGATTVGNLLFGDVGNSYGWTLATGSGGPLTLAVVSGSPTITVNGQTNTISLVLDGTQGLTKAGGGTLVLSGANTLSGLTSISGGTLQLGDGIANNGVIASNMTLAGGTTLAFANPSGQSYLGIITNNSGIVVQKGAGALTLGVGGQITGTNSTITIAPGTTINLSGVDAAAGNNRLPYLSNSVWNINGTVRSTTTAANTMPPSVILNGGTMTGTTNCYASFGIYFANNTTITANGTGNSISLPGANGVGIGTLLTLNTPLAADALTVAATINPQNAAGSLVKSGAGTVTLTGTNTYTGSTTISGGTLTISGAGRLGNGVYAGAITDNGALNYSSAANQTLSGVISGTGALTNNGPGTVTLTATATYTGNTAVNGGALLLSSVAGLHLATPTTPTGAVLWLDASDPSTLFTDTNGTTAVTTSGDVIARWNDKSGNNNHVIITGTQTGPAYQTAVALGKSGARFSSSTNCGMTTPVTVSSGNLSIFVAYSYRSGTSAARRAVQGQNNWLMGPYNNAYQTYNGAFVSGAPAVVANQLVVHDVAVITGGSLSNFVNGVFTGARTSGTLTYPGKLYLGAGGFAAAEPLDGDIAEVLVYNTALTTAQRQNIEAYLAQKWGAGLGALDNASAVSVASSSTFGGFGAAGAVTVASGGAINGSLAGVGTLTLSNLTYSGTGTLTVGATSNGLPLNVTSSLSVGGPVSIALANTPALNSTNHVLRSANAPAGFGSFVLAPSRYALSLITNGNYLDLVVGPTAAFPIWTGAFNSTWSTATITAPKNWKLNTDSSPTDFLPLDAVYFDDSATTTTPTISAANVSPGSTTFSNVTKSYALSGAFGINSGSLTKNGSGLLTISNVNTYAGGTTISNGTVEFVSGGLGGGPVNLNGTSTLRLIGTSSATVPLATANGITATLDTTTNAMTVNTALGGTGTALTKTGAGTLSLTTVASTYTGGTLINAGTVQLVRPGSIPAAGTATVNTGATLLLNPNGATWGTGLTNISLNGGTLAMTADIGNSRYTFVGASNVPTASSFITVHAGSAGSPNASDLFLDTGLTGSGTVTISVDTNGIGVGLRTSSTSFSGTIIVNGNPTALGSLGSGLTLGNAAGQPTLTNADLEINGTMELGNTGMGWANSTVNGLTTLVGALNGSGVVVANMGTAGFTRGLNIGGNNHNGVFSGVIANGNNATLSLTKSGTGTQVLLGANTYTGTTTVNGGTLQVNASGQLAGPVTVQSGGTLGGNGFLSGAVNVQAGGTLSVGTNSALATLAINNALTLAANSTNVMRISKNGNVPANDQITGLTSVTYGGTLVLVNTTTDASPLALGDTFTLYPFATSYNTNSGFANAILPALPAGLSWNLNNLTVDGTISVANQVSTPLISPAGGGYVGAQNVTISCATAGATIRYTTDGSTPTSSSPVYSGPITVPAPTNAMTIKAYATKAGSADSAVASADYHTVVTPTWLNAFGGNWSDASSWSNTVVANGVGVTADFSTLNLSSGAPTVTLNTAATVGALLFADQGNVNGWTLADGGAGPLTLAAAVGQPVINTGNTNIQTIISAGLAGTNGFIKAGAGTLTLSGPNTYTGNTTVNAGVGGLKFTTAPSFTTFIGNGTVEFNLGTTVGMAGTIGSGFTGQINLAGAGTALGTGNSMTNNLGDVHIDTGASIVINGVTVQADELTGPGLVSTVGAIAPTFANLVLGANNGNGTNAVFSGPITSSTILGTQSISIVKNGTGAQTLSGNLATALGTVTVNAGTLTLSGTNSYTGATTVSNGTLRVEGSLAAGSAVTVVGGTLAGNGLINGPVSVNGTLSPGASIGTLTISNNLTLAGNVWIEVDKALAQSNDVVTVSGSLSYGGTLTATNIGGTALVVGDSFPVFPAGGTGSFTLAGSPGPGLAWSFSPASGVLSVVPGVSTTPPHLTNSVSGGTLTLSWPADHLGWKLQCQTNSRAVGLSNNWITIPGSETMTSTNIPVSPANPTLFYRLTYP